MEWKREATKLSRLLGRGHVRVRRSLGSATLNMPPLLLLQLYVVACVAGVAVWAGPAETVVGVAGRRVSLPCRVAAAKRKGVHVCWGRGEPAFFSCHNVLVNAVGERLMYKSSYRYSVSSAPSKEPQLSIFNVRPSDSGLYHCRVQLPGPFNDKTFSVLLIVIPRGGNLNTPLTIKGGSTEVVTGSDVTQSVQLWEGSVDDTTGPVVARVQKHVRRQDGHNLRMFLGNTLRMAFIVFIPAVILTAAYRIRKSNQRAVTGSSGRESEEAEDDVYV
ncbi:hepatitis A virus cellular receptor 1-like [Hippocampus zosterae]|uniref:hepatitis A virus cellular receptor 1-like n=1 Tax=Hippocampus zosterae TaxID=109293 RepID=UPI00223E5710|nr:hepatitis A virus cellular receptor 1-like [Hippocampus zosterae]